MPIIFKLFILKWDKISFSQSFLVIKLSSYKLIKGFILVSIDLTNFLFCIKELLTIISEGYILPNSSNTNA